jgi:hypothetical protein
MEEVRFETAPAQQAQCDWADFGDVVEDGQTQPLALFVLIPGYSRHTFACFSTSMDEATLQRAHQDAFADFGRRTARDPLRQHKNRDNGPRSRWTSDLATQLRGLRWAIRISAVMYAVLSG